jgi:CRP-like cAMP-binding protein
MEPRSYMTGQTIVVMGAQDASQMFILKSGHVELEARNGVVVKTLTTGATFGEMVMLGVTRRRTITIRASTICFTLEIDRATFLAALDQNPEERIRFEQLAMRNMDLDSAVIWPVLRGSPEKMLLLLNLHAERRMCAVKDPFLATPAIKDAALLLLQGTASIWNKNGEEVQPLKQGECFNEQILLNVENKAGEYVVPKTVCEVQIVTKQGWDKVLEEFVTEQEHVRKVILRHMAERAEFRLGVVPGSTTMLKSSALFRGTSQPFVQAIRERLKNSLYRPGSSIIKADNPGDGYYLLLDGTAEARLRDMTFELSSGASFGEAALSCVVPEHI